MLILALQARPSRFTSKLTLQTNTEDRWWQRELVQRKEYSGSCLRMHHRKLGRRALRNDFRSPFSRKFRKILTPTNTCVPGLGTLQVLHAIWTRLTYDRTDSMFVVQEEVYLNPKSRGPLCLPGSLKGPALPRGEILPLLLLSKQALSYYLVYSIN